MGKGRGRLRMTAGRGQPRAVFLGGAGKVERSMECLMAVDGLLNDLIGQKSPLI
ncbi:MAG: hypothetical protein JZU50_11795 [Desulfobulbaceae bacterium]|nr:hypothetical protein [Desulfobulbaceae bacterium]